MISGGSTLDVGIRSEAKITRGGNLAAVRTRSEGCPATKRSISQLVGAGGIRYFQKSIAVNMFE